jgi:hypothetical protein
MSGRTIYVGRWPSRTKTAIADPISADKNGSWEIERRRVVRAAIYRDEAHHTVAADETFPPLQRSSSFLEGMGDLAKKSGLPVFWQIAHDVRRF